MDSSSSFGTIVSLFIKSYLRLKTMEYVSVQKNLPRFIKANGLMYRERVVLKRKSPCTLLKKLFIPTDFSFTLRVLCRVCHVLAVRRLRWRRHKRD